MVRGAGSSVIPLPWAGEWLPEVAIELITRRNYAIRKTSQRSFLRRQRRPRREVPLDNQFKEWTVTTLPSNWEQLRDRWEWFHVIRSWDAVTGLALLLAGALFWRDNATRRPSVEPDAPREQPHG
jgi:hypothetical protein